MTNRSFQGFTFSEFQSLPISFTFDQFHAATPLNENSMWEFLYERNIDSIGVKKKEAVQENLRKIFLATFRLANTIGFRAMTQRDLCRETGLSMGGLYGYISNKDQIALMIEDLVRYVSQLFPKWFEHIADPLDQLESMLRAYVFHSELMQPWFYFVFLESRVLSKEQRNIAKEGEFSTQSHIAKLLEATGVLTQLEAQLLATHCMALAQDWHLKRWKFRSAGVPPDAFADSVVQLVRARVEIAGRMQQASHQTADSSLASSPRLV